MQVHYVSDLCKLFTEGKCRCLLNVNDWKFVAYQTPEKLIRLSIKLIKFVADFTILFEEESS